MRKNTHFSDQDTTLIMEDKFTSFYCFPRVLSSFDLTKMCVPPVNIKDALSASYSAGDPVTSR